jgi:hypothetical protein
VTQSWLRPFYAFQGPPSNRRSILALGLLAGLTACVGKSALNRGASIGSDAKTSGEFVRSGSDYERLKRVGGQVGALPQNGRPWQYGLIAHDNPVALAFVDGNVIVSTSLLALCENDGQVAASLAMATLMPRPQGASKAAFAQNQQVSSIERDGAIIRTLAKAGYDPRDALAIAKRQSNAATAPQGNQGPRWAAMETELRRLGYQV